MAKKFQFTFTDRLNPVDLVKNGLSPWIPVNGSNNIPIALNLKYDGQSFTASTRKQVSDLNNMTRVYENDPSLSLWSTFVPDPDQGFEVSKGGGLEPIKEDIWRELTFNVPIIVTDRDSGAPYDQAWLDAVVTKSADTYTSFDLIPSTDQGYPLFDNMYSGLTFRASNSRVLLNILASISVKAPRLGSQVKGMKRYLDPNGEDDGTNRIMLVKNADGTFWQLPFDWTSGGPFRFGGGYYDITGAVAVCFYSGWQDGDMIEFWY
jgi:hypothetical protein